MASYAQGLFTPINKQKYIGKNIPKYRSGWELTFMRHVLLLKIIFFGILGKHRP